VGHSRPVTGLLYLFYWPVKKEFRKAILQRVPFANDPGLANIGWCVIMCGRTAVPSRRLHIGGSAECRTVT
jgi:hypothetical protein